MLIVTSLFGEIEALTDIQGIEVYEEVNGDFSLSFTSLNTENNKHSYGLLTEESIVELDNQEFRVKKVNESRNRKTIVAQHVFFDLIDQMIYEINGGTKTIDEFFNIALNGTEWTFDNMDINYSRLIPDFGEDNALSLIRLICEVFECEISIEPNRHLKIFKRIGENNDAQFRYKHNIKTLQKSIDTSKLSTVIKGYGGEGLEVTYTSPNASIYGERHAEPIRDDRFTIADSLIERLKQEISDVPEVSIQLETVDLGLDVGLGDSVWTIYEPMNLEFLQRVISRKWYPFTKRSPVVTLSNKQKALSDLLTETRIEITENKKQTRSKFEQTNERIGLEVERIDESIATLEIEADNITLSVQSLDTRMGSAESTISIQSGLISSKVSYGDVMSAIEQSPETIKLSASRIELSGITEVAHTLQIGTNNPQSGTRTIQMDDWSNITAHSDYSSMELYSSGYIYLDGHIKLGQGIFGGATKNIDFGNVNLQNMPTVPNASNAYYLNGYSSSSFVTTSQGLYISLNSAGTMSVTTSSGKTATFFPDSWTG